MWRGSRSQTKVLRPPPPTRTHSIDKGSVPSGCREVPRTKFLPQRTIDALLASVPRASVEPRDRHREAGGRCVKMQLVPRAPRVPPPANKVQARKRRCHTKRTKLRRWTELRRWTPRPGRELQIQGLEHIELQSRCGTAKPERAPGPRPRATWSYWYS